MSHEQIDDLYREYRTVYPARGHKSTTLYPGVAEGLAALGGRKSTATTKGTPTTRPILEQFGLLPYFDHVQGTDGFPCKPAPDVIFKSLEALEAKPEDCLFVGDSAPDMEAGRRAGVKTCAVRYGYGDIRKMAQFTPDYWIDDIRQLIPVEVGDATQVYLTKLKPECRADYIEAHRNVSSDLMRRYRDAGMRVCAVYMLNDYLVLLTDADDHEKTSAILAADPVDREWQAL